MKIYDCITFFNELDLLEIRLNVLNDLVDYFVINEATVTFQGNPKPLYYLENKERFATFSHKIIHNIVDDTPKTNNNWDNDTYHKNCTMRALTKCSNEDIIIYSDADEIPNPDIIRSQIDSKDLSNHLVVFWMDYYVFYLNVIHKGIPFPGTRLTSWGFLKQYSIDSFRNHGSDFHKNNPDKVSHVEKSGCHFTSLGGKEAIKLKIESWGHAEYNNDFIKSRIESNLNNLTDLFGRQDFVGTKVDIIEKTHPLYIVKNQEKYKHLILE